MVAAVAGEREAPVGHPAWIWGARGLLAFAVTAVLVTRATRPTWILEGENEFGLPAAWQPNVTMFVVVAVGILWPWLSGLAAFTTATFRHGDVITARTILGKRRVKLSHSRVLSFRVPTKTGTAHAALLVDHGRPLVICDFSSSDGQLVREITGRQRATAIGEVIVQYVIGIAWLLTTPVVVYALAVLALALTGSWSVD